SSLHAHERDHVSGIARQLSRSTLDALSFSGRLLRIAGFKMQQARLPRTLHTLGVDPGCCGVPPEAPRSVTATRLCIVLSIVI
ncbi:unnamed protein product, partial [Ectocarpus fasciculatus]